MVRTELIRPLPELLALHAEARPDKLAFRDPDNRVSYGELFTRSRRLGGHLRELGTLRGEPVAIHMANRVEAVESYLGITRAAGVGVYVNPGGAREEVRHMLADSGAAIVITDDANVERLESIVADGTSVREILVVGEAPARAGRRSYEDLLAAEPTTPTPDDLPLDAPAWMLYTSGTTGRPKGVLLSQRNCLWVVAACWAPIVGLSESDNVLSALPLFHSFALDLSVLGVVAVGASEYLLPRFTTDGVLERLREEPITFLPGVPTMFHYLAERAGPTGFAASRLRLCVSAGAIMSAALNRRFEEISGVALLDGYGITETSTMVTMNWPHGGRPMGSCGLPIPGSSVRIVEPGGDAEAAIDEDGELLVHGPHVMLGYHNQPEATAAVLRDGWYRTGDLGRRDRDGYLKITGRIKELIIRGGENIYPAEVEEVLVTHDSVLDCAVVGAPHEALGEVPIGFVVLPEDRRFDEHAVVEHCRRGLADFKVPGEFRVIDEIPRTGSGKVIRYQLVEALADSEPSGSRAD